MFAVHIRIVARFGVKIRPE